MTRHLASIVLTGVFGAIFGLVVVSPSCAQDDDEPLFEEFVSTVKRDYFAPGLLVQALADFAENRGGGGNGFRLGTARLKVGGRLDQGFGYQLQTDFTRAPAVIDARLDYSFSAQARLSAGMFKAPFSSETLISSASTDFINRSRAVSLAPGRQIGVALNLRSAGNRVLLQGGIFNGNGRNLGGNDNNSSMYAGRIKVMPQMSSGRLEVAGNVAYSEDDNASFEGTRVLVGGDFRFTTQRWLASAEFVYADLDAVDEPDSQPSGFHVTTGYMAVPNRHQLLFRLDTFDPDMPGPTSDFVIFGYNFWPTSAFEVQVNYFLPIDDVGSHRVLVNFQVAL